MPRTKCRVCTSPDREAIDQAIIRGGSYRTIAEEYGLGRMSIQRHAASHLPATLARAHEAHEVARADDLLAQVRQLQDRALGILRRAERKGDLRSASGAIREARGLIELLGKLAGQLQDGVTVNVALLPEWTALRGRILVALEPHPEAREAVIKALEADNAP
jgi:transposase-like protein